MIGNTDEDFWSLVEEQEGPNGCWVWTGRIVKCYGQFSVPKLTKQRWVHRIAWELSGRTLTRGLVLRHACGNKLCVRPEHHEEMTQRECNRLGKQTKVSFEMAELIKEDLKDIHLEKDERAKWDVYRKLADKWGISATGIHSICLNVAPSCIPLKKKRAQM